MSTRHRLEQLLENPRVWKAGQGGLRRRVVSTGFATLDAALHGGWPVGRLIELLVEPHGIGELGLLLPALVGQPGADKHGPGKWIVLIAPPYIPYAPAFAARGLKMSRLLVVRCRQQAEVLWAAEQALHSNTCSAVLAWSDGADERSLRRLQLAAEAGGACLLVLFRSLRLRRRRSPAALRIQLRPAADGTLELDVFKNHGGRPRVVAVRVGRRTRDG